ncbi:hypothetical protein QJS66_12900 [Kocuria rhizophila]|nr:hypothetical protein QJS66_12900 [Kocuria rhizophila]
MVILVRGGTPDPRPPAPWCWAAGIILHVGHVHLCTGRALRPRVLRHPQAGSTSTTASPRGTWISSHFSFNLGMTFQVAHQREHHTAARR